MSRKENENAYKIVHGKTVKFEVEVTLDPTRGAWHEAEDFLVWFCSNNYVQSANVKADKEK